MPPTWRYTGTLQEIKIVDSSLQKTVIKRIGVVIVFVEYKGPWWALPGHGTSPAAARGCQKTTPALLKDPGCGTKEWEFGAHYRNG